MFNVESKPPSQSTSGQPSVFSRLTANKRVLFAAVGVLLFCIVGAVSAGLLYYFSDSEEPASNLSQDPVPGPFTPSPYSDVLLGPWTTPWTAARAFRTFKNLVVNNRLATAGITLAIVAVLVGVIVTTVLLSQSETNTVVDPTPVDPEPVPEPEPVDPQPVVPEEEESGMGLWTKLGIGAVVGGVVILIIGAGAVYHRRVQSTRNADNQVQPLIPEPRNNQDAQPQPPIIQPQDIQHAQPQPSFAQLPVDQLTQPQHPALVCRSLNVDPADSDFEFWHCQKQGKTFLAIQYLGDKLKKNQKYRFVPVGEVDSALSARFKQNHIVFDRTAGAGQKIKLDNVYVPDEMTLRLQSQSVNSNIFFDVQPKVEVIVSFKTEDHDSE